MLVVGRPPVSLHVQYRDPGICRERKYWEWKKEKSPARRSLKEEERRGRSFSITG
jgi:hypothetical protein